MLAQSSSHLPIDLRGLTENSISPYNRGPGFGAGFHGCGCDPVNGCKCSPGFHGFHGGHGGSSHSGMGRMGGITSFRGLHQGTSLDSIIQSAANWLGGFAQSQLPTSASVPPQYGSAGAISTQIQQYMPYLLIGGIVYLLTRK